MSGGTEITKHLSGPPSFQVNLSNQLRVISFKKIPTRNFLLMTSNASGAKVVELAVHKRLLHAIVISVILHNFFAIIINMVTINGHVPRFEESAIFLHIRLVIQIIKEKYEKSYFVKLIAILTTFKLAKCSICWSGHCRRRVIFIRSRSVSLIVQFIAFCYLLSSFDTQN